MWALELGSSIISTNYLLIVCCCASPTQLCVLGSRAWIYSRRGTHMGGSVCGMATNGKQEKQSKSKFSLLPGVSLT